MEYKNQMEKESLGRYRVLAHVSAVPNGERCGWGVYISLSPIERKVFYGESSKSDSKAYAVYAELMGVKCALEYFAGAGILDASVKLTREKALQALTEGTSDPGCGALVKQINALVGDNEYLFALEKESRGGAAYQMAARAVGQFSFIDGYKWRDSCDANVTRLVKFAVQDFYTRKKHESYEYLNLANMYEQYKGSKCNNPVPLPVKRVFDLYFKDQKKQDVASVFYKSGLLPKDACKCALELLNRGSAKQLEADVRGMLLLMVKKQDQRNRSGRLGDRDFQLVVDRLYNGYYAGEYPLRTLEEAVQDEYLNVLVESLQVRGREIPKKRVYASTDPKTESCVVCGRALKNPEGAYRCTDRDITNVLRRKGYFNRFCSPECLMRAVGVSKGA